MKEEKDRTLANKLGIERMFKIKTRFESELLVSVS
jgi:hypothetical protein